jgi:hemerythrin superfamily protein
MSFLDKLVAAVTPLESDEERATARHNAEVIASEGGWLSVVLDHHRQIEAAFNHALSASDDASKTAELKRLQLILTGHANAEESVLYPAMTDAGEKADTAMAYEEQAMTKVQLAQLEKLNPSSQEWRDKLEHIQGAVLHHIYQEESSWFPKLQQNVLPADRSFVSQRFIEEFERYTGRQGSREQSLSDQDGAEAGLITAPSLRP